MLCNSQQLRELRIIPGTRMLEDPLLSVGCPVTDFREPWRHWKLHWVFAPIPGRRLGGVRAKLIDHKGFVGFLNQRDLEVSLGHGKPGQWCEWLGAKYVSPDDNEWCGICCDSEDLKDDLFERECWLRQQPELAQYPYLPTNLELKRRIHLDVNNDVEELSTLRGDIDFDTGHYPDPRFETVERRWTRIQREPLIWERLT